MKWASLEGSTLHLFFPEAPGSTWTYLERPPESKVVERMQHLRDHSTPVSERLAMLRFCQCIHCSSFYGQVCLIQRNDPSSGWQALCASLTLLAELPENRTGRRKHLTSVFSAGGVGWEGTRPGSDVGCSSPFVISAHGLEVKLNLLYNLSPSKSGVSTLHSICFWLFYSPDFRGLKSKMNKRY